MLADTRVTAFLATTRAGRAIAFYCDTLGLRRVEESPFAVVLDAGGVELRLQKVETFTPQPFTALGWRVADIAATVDELTSRGIAFERFPGMEQDQRGIWKSPAGARVAWFRDPDGNILSLTEHPQAHRRKR